MQYYLKNKDLDLDILLVKNVVILGRDESSDIRIKESTVSRKHAVLIKKTDKWYLQDSHSTNGTFLNGNRLESDKAVLLKIEDEIMLGKTVRLIFHSNSCKPAEEKKCMMDLEMIQKLFPVIDTLEYGIKTYNGDENNPHLQGLLKIRSQLLGVLSEYGVLQMEALNKPFDAKVHNAISHIENPHYPSSVVVEVVQSGYLYEGKVLRYADVVVAN